MPLTVGEVMALTDDEVDAQINALQAIGREADAELAQRAANKLDGQVAPLAEPSPEPDTSPPATVSGAPGGPEQVSDGAPSGTPGAHYTVATSQKIEHSETGASIKICAKELGLVIASLVSGVAPAFVASLGDKLEARLATELLNEEVEDQVIDPESMSLMVYSMTKTVTDQTGWLAWGGAQSFKMEVKGSVKYIVAGTPQAYSRLQRIMDSRALKHIKSLELQVLLGEMEAGDK